MEYNALLTELDFTKASIQKWVIFPAVGSRVIVEEHCFENADHDWIGRTWVLRRAESQVSAMRDGKIR